MAQPLYVVKPSQISVGQTAQSITCSIMEKPHAGPRVIKRMSGIRVDDITQYMCDPLRKCLRDEDPYVRKTAAISVAKLYDISPQLVEEHGFIDLLQDLFSDSNPMVVSNAVAALSDISEASANGRPVLDVGPRVAIQLAKIFA